MRASLAIFLFLAHTFLFGFSQQVQRDGFSSGTDAHQTQVLFSQSYNQSTSDFLFKRSAFDGNLLSGLAPYLFNSFFSVVSSNQQLNKEARFQQFKNRNLFILFCSLLL